MKSKTLSRIQHISNDSVTHRSYFGAIFSHHSLTTPAFLTGVAALCCNALDARFCAPQTEKETSMDKYKAIQYLLDKCIVAIVRADTGGDDLVRVVEAVAKAASTALK